MVTVYRGNPLSFEAETFRQEAQPIFYAGHSISNVSNPAAGSWTNVLDHLTPLDDAQEGVFRNANVFTVSQPGRYLLAFSVVGNAALNTYSGARVQLRGTTILQQAQFTAGAAHFILALTGVVLLASGDEIVWEMINTPTGVPWASTTLGGEQTHTANFSIVRLSA